MVSINNYLVISALGPNRLNNINETIRVCTQCGCNILHSKINTLGQEIAITLFVSGNWGAIAKLEATLPSLEKQLDLSFLIRRTSNEIILKEKAITYNIQITAIDKQGILNGLTDFFLEFAIPIDEIIATTFLSHTNTRMLNLVFKIHVPNSIHLATFREKFISYCDDNNLDAFLEPYKS